jgi:dolichol-phosphate mannosyltransferase
MSAGTQTARMSNAAKLLLVTADDYGLSRGVTDSILDTADCGSVTNVSIMPNGDAFEYALKQYLERKDRLNLSVHFNLTEGIPVAKADDVRLLVGPDGLFKYSVFGLAAAYFFSSERTLFRAQIRNELEAQFEKVRSVLAGRADIFSANGHQHVHMLPFVYRELASLEGVPRIRVPREPFHISDLKDILFSATRFPQWLALALLSRGRFERRLTDRFVGVLYSGQMTIPRAESGLSRALELGCSSLELLFHPGSAGDGELRTWRKYLGFSWHFSAHRAEERAALKTTEFARMSQSFRKNTMPVSGFFELFRYIIAGGIATGTNILLLYVLTDLAGVWYVFSAVCSYTAAIGVSFLLHKFWTFSNLETSRVHYELAWFSINSVAGLIVDAAGLYFLVEWFGMWYVLAQIELLGAIAAWNFFLYRFVLFAKR